MKTQWMEEAVKCAQKLQSVLGIIHHEGYPAEAKAEFEEVRAALIYMESLTPRLKEIAKKYPIDFFDGKF